MYFENPIFHYYPHSVEIVFCCICLLTQCQWDTKIEGRDAWEECKGKKAVLSVQSFCYLYQLVCAFSCGCTSSSIFIIIVALNVFLRELFADAWRELLFHILWNSNNEATIKSSVINILRNFILFKCLGKVITWFLYIACN